MTARIRFALVAAVALGGDELPAENDLPRRQAGEATNGSALFRDLGDVLPGKELPNFELLAPEPGIDVGRAKADLDRALRKEQRWQQLVKAGVLSRVEAEAAVLATARARARYEAARVAGQQRALDALRERAPSGQVSPDAVKAAESALQTAQAMAAEAETALQSTALLLAKTNVERQRRLLTLGVGSRSQLTRAESALLQLQGAAR